MQLYLLFTETPGLSPVLMVPWVIEAPVNSVEILEAILKPSHPFQVDTARHVHRGCNETATDKRQLNESRKLYSKYTQLQGRLELIDRDISFICAAGIYFNSLERAWRVADLVSPQNVCGTGSLDARARRRHCRTLLLRKRWTQTEKMQMPPR